MRLLWKRCKSDDLDKDEAEIEVFEKSEKDEEIEYLERREKKALNVSEIEYDEWIKDDESGLLIMNMIEWMMESELVLHVTNEESSIEWEMMEGRMKCEMWKGENEVCCLITE